MPGRSKVEKNRQKVKRQLIIWSLCVGCITAADAQSTFTQRLQQSKTGEGKITIVQDKAIDALVNGPRTAAVREQGQAPVTPQKQTQEKTPAIPIAGKQDNKGGTTTTPKPAPAEQPQLTDTATTEEDNRKKVMKGGYKINGYRVQIYAGGNSRSARVQAERVGREVNALFPGEPVYVHFYSPRWICRMGNYRTYEEAHEILRAVKKLGYASAIIVKGKITVPYPPTAGNTP